MIVDNINMQNRYSCGEAWEIAFDYLRSLDKNIEDGKYNIKGDDIFAVVSTYETKPRHKFEAHKEYVDIQCLLSGEEILEYTSSECALLNPYDKDKDIMFLEAGERSTSVCLHSGVFAVLFPEELHMPGVIYDESMTVKKVVVKIRAKLLNL